MTTVLKISSVSHLRTCLTYAHVCEHLGIPLNGSSLERRVSKLGKRRSDKFIKHLKGKTVPTYETIRELAKLAPNVLPLFYCPVWPVLSLIEGSGDDYLKCFEMLNLDVQMCVLQTERNAMGKLLLKEVRNKDIRQLHRIGGLHALACFILLRFLRDEGEEFDGVSKHAINNHILNTIINLRVAEVLPSNFSLLIRALSNAFAWNTLSSMQVHIEPKRIDEEITNKKALLLNLKKLHPCRPLNYSLKVLGLFDHGNSNLIFRETKFASESNLPLIQLSPPTKRGLYWLLKKLNQHREPLYKHTLKQYENNFYFYRPFLLVQ